MNTDYPVPGPISTPAGRDFRQSESAGESGEVWYGGAVVLVVKAFLM